MELLYVAVGGALGSIARYGLSQLIHSQVETRFPLGTLLVNWAGCLLIGLLVGGLERANLLHDSVRLFLIVGIMGGFTTFSSFSFESITLVKQGMYGQAVAYVLLSLGVGLMLTVGGFWLARSVRF